jgi:F0F1-type ATP synthase membrane subunit b/b'
MKLIGVFTLVSTILGFLYGAFEIYKDYMDMKEQIQSYVAPDLSGFQEQLSVMEATMSKLQESVIEARDYTRDIKVDLKADIDRIEAVVDKTEQRVKDSEADVRDMIDLAETRFDTKRDQLSAQTESKLKSIEEDLNGKIQKALDNPLAN